MSIYGSTYLAKFSSYGTVLWATYYGAGYATSDETSNNIATDSKGNVFITGAAGSNAGIVTSGAYKTSLTGANVFLSKFSPDGVLVWGTYFGGNWTDESNAVATDNDGNVFISGNTGSSTGIATSGAHQTAIAILGRQSTAFLAKFDNNGSLKWATYYGGRGYDEANAIATDINGNAYLTGTTSSGEGISTPGAYKTVYQGGGISYDAFIAKFSPNGDLLWGTYYGGDLDDEGNGIASDASGNIYITGWTQSTSAIATSGAFQTSFGGGAAYEPNDAFLAQFSNDGALEWATYFGGNGQDEGANVAADCSGNIFIYGNTSSSKGVATSGAFLTKNSSGTAAFLGQFSNSGQLIWATYYGKVNDGEGMAIDGLGNIYIAGNTLADSGIATKYAYQKTRSGDYDAFLVRFNFPKYDNDAGLLSVIGLNDSICPGVDPVSFRFYNYGSKIINSSVFNWEVNGILQQPYTWHGTLYPCSFIDVIIGTFDFSPGQYTVTARVSQPNGIKDSTPYNDTATIYFNFQKPSSQWTVQGINSLTKTFSAVDMDYKSNSYFWNFGDSTSSTGHTVTHTYKDEGKYKVSLTLCNEVFDSSIWVIDHNSLNIFPNPFSLQTDINYALLNSAHVKISLTDELGQQLGTLLDEQLAQGEYNTYFDAALWKTRPAMYFILFQLDDKLIVKKIIQLDSIYH